MDLKEIWIGEPMRVISTGRIGKFEGLAKDGRARVSSAGKIYLVKGDNLEKYSEPKIDKVKALKDELEDKRVGLDSHLKFESSIDLHIQKLSPNLANGTPEHILQFQLRSCKSYLMKAIDLRMSNVLIIHGKGAGVLKSEVLALISSFAEVSTHETVNNDGAQRVYFQY